MVCFDQQNVCNSTFRFSDRVPLGQLKYTLNSFWSQPETNHVLNRLATCHLVTLNVGVTTRFFKLLIIFKNFYGEGYIFSCHLPSKLNTCVSRTSFVRGLRHLQVHAYSWISV